MMPLRAIIALVRTFPRRPLLDVAERPDLFYRTARVVDYELEPEDAYGNGGGIKLYWRET